MKTLTIKYTLNDTIYSACVNERVYNIIRHARNLVKYGKYIIGYSNEVDAEHSSHNGMFSVSITNGTIARYSSISDWLFNGINYGEHITVKKAIIECSKGHDVIKDIIDLGTFSETC